MIFFSWETCGPSAGSVDVTDTAVVCEGEAGDAAAPVVGVTVTMAAGAVWPSLRLPDGACSFRLSSVRCEK